MTPASIKSWKIFAVELEPQRRARHLVLLSAWLLLLAGTVVILAVDLSIWAKICVAALWWLDTGLAVVRLFARTRRVQRFTLAPRAMASLTVGGSSRTAVWCPGSVVTAHWAWVRLRVGKCVYSELFLRREVEPDRWRRLQVLWRWGTRV